MSAHVLLNLLNELRKSDKMRGLPSILSLYPTSLINSTRMRSRWGAIANPHAKCFDHQHPYVQPLGHDPGHRMKTLFDMFYIYIC